MQPKRLSVQPMQLKRPSNQPLYSACGRPYAVNTCPRAASNPPSSLLDRHCSHKNCLCSPNGRTCKTNSRPCNPNGRPSSPSCSPCSPNSRPCNANGCPCSSRGRAREHETPLPLFVPALPRAHQAARTCCGRSPLLFVHFCNILLFQKKTALPLQK